MNLYFYIIFYFLFLFNISLRFIFRFSIIFLFSCSLYVFSTSKNIASSLCLKFEQEKIKYTRKIICQEYSGYVWIIVEKCFLINIVFFKDILLFIQSYFKHNFLIFKKVYITILKHFSYNFKYKQIEYYTHVNMCVKRDEVCDTGFQRTFTLK